ncbi:MAG: PKD domain-containing protein, partial [Candidatus Bathyarchaeota archaeon]|nr:PKD domain-containing protein [Candidatus Bathyarchaeota archaeon]
MQLKKIIKQMGMLFVLIIVLNTSPFIFTVSGATVYPEVTVYLYRIQAVDNIEDLLEFGEPDWVYQVYLYTGTAWENKDYTCSDNDGDIIVSKSHSFTVSRDDVSLQIWLYDSDTGHYDIADISGADGGGMNGWTSGAVPDGAKYHGTYNLRTNILDGDNVFSESGFFKTSGDYDGSVTTDQNDANIWFQIFDNYDSPTSKAGSDRTTYTNEKVNFDGRSSQASDGSSIMQYEWDFENDGIIDATGSTTSYTYTQAGTYTVSLKVTDSIGVTDIDYLNVFVQSIGPEAAFTYTPSTPTIQDSIYFYDTSEANDGSITKWQWTFGDGGTSNLKDPTHQYKDKGQYQVKLTVTDSNQLTDQYIEYVEVINIAPSADFT